MYTWRKRYGIPIQSCGLRMLGLSFLHPSSLFSSLSLLPFPSLSFPSLPFPSLPFPSLPFPSLPFPSLPLKQQGPVTGSFLDLDVLEVNNSVAAFCQHFAPQLLTISLSMIPVSRILYKKIRHSIRLQSEPLVRVLNQQYDLALVYLPMPEAKTGLVGPCCLPTRVLLKLPPLLRLR